jgi:hypothetical protein
MSNVLPLRGKRMIKMTWGQIRDPQFNEIIAKVYATSMPLKAARRLVKITDAVKKEQEQSDQVFKLLADRLLEPLPNTNMSRIKAGFTPEETKAAQDELDEFMKTPVEIQQEPLNILEVPKLELTAWEYMKIDGIVHVDEN